MKLFSIVIPTVGRIDALKEALLLFKDQILQYETEVELIVSDNGSSDGTYKELGQNRDYDWLTYYRFENQVDYADSIQRAISISNGKYVMFFGDDDIPFPTFVCSILHLIKYYPNVGLFHFNVIIGKDYGDGMFRNLKMENPLYETSMEFCKIDEMLYKHPISMSFITTVVFSREVWNRGIKLYDNSLKGYPHLSIWYNGIQNDDCIYYPYPIAYGRMPYNKDYLDKWPRYFLIEIPKLMKEIDENGITDHLYITWINTPDFRSFPKFCNTLLMASVYKEKYKPLCKEINKYQDNRIRKILTYLIIYFVPSGIYGLIRKKLYKQ